MSDDNVIDLQTIRTIMNTREMTEQEVRGALYMMYYAVEFAAVKMIHWSAYKKPGKMELEDNAFLLHTASRMVTDLGDTGKITDGHQFDSLAEHFMLATKEMRDKYKKVVLGE